MSLLSSEMHQQSTHSWIGLAFCPAGDIPHIPTTTSRTRNLQACSVHYRFFKGGQKGGLAEKLPNARRQQRCYERCGKDSPLRVGFAMQLTRLEYATQQWWASVKFALGLTMIVVLRLYRILLIRAERRLHVILMVITIVHLNVRSTIRFKVGIIIWHVFGISHPAGRDDSLTNLINPLAYLGKKKPKFNN